MEEEKRKKRKKVLIAAVLIAAAVIYSGISHRQSDDIEVKNAAVPHAEDMSADQSEEGEDSSSGDGAEDSEISEKNGEEASEKNSADIFVDVGGAVRDPRVVRIGKGARVYEAVEAAGGVTADAETKYINMAAECNDGQKIYVPTKEETEAAQSGENSDSKLFSTDASELDSGKANEQGTAGNKVNINTATSEQLQTLNGIGPSMAARIIEYRQANGKFKSVDELTNVSGIGEKILAKFAADICV